MLGITLQLLGERDAPADRCPVCHRPVRVGGRALRVRGMSFHSDCAGYRLRREHVPAALRARSDAARGAGHGSRDLAA
jgi:hypothetical protein